MDYYECKEPEFSDHIYWSSKTFIPVTDAKSLYAYLRNIHQCDESFSGKKIDELKNLQRLCSEEIDLAIKIKHIHKGMLKVDVDTSSFYQIPIIMMNNFITWVSKKISLPEEYHALILAIPPTPPEDQDKPSKLRNNQRHKERSRAIAELLWSKNSETTIADMIICNEIITYGCEGKLYNEKVVREWINYLAPNRKPGRRPENE